MAAVPCKLCKGSGEAETKYYVYAEVSSPKDILNLKDLKPHPLSKPCERCNAEGLESRARENVHGWFPEDVKKWCEYSQTMFYNEYDTEKWSKMHEDALAWEHSIYWSADDGKYHWKLPCEECGGDGRITVVSVHLCGKKAEDVLHCRYDNAITLHNDLLKNGKTTKNYCNCCEGGLKKK